MVTADILHKCTYCTSGCSHVPAWLWCALDMCNMRSAQKLSQAHAMGPTKNDPSIAPALIMLAPVIVASFSPVLADTLANRLR